MTKVLLDIVYDTDNDNPLTKLVVSKSIDGSLVYFKEEFRDRIYAVNAKELLKALNIL